MRGCILARAGRIGKTPPQVIATAAAAAAAAAPPLVRPLLETARIELRHVGRFHKRQRMMINSLKLVPLSHEHFSNP